MESDRRKIEEIYLKAVDIGYSYRLAKKMEEFKSNPVLGYRTAGSKAEFDTGEFLKEEMKRIGLSDIHKDELCLDSWEFEKAIMRFTDRAGKEHEFQLGAYQTEFVTDGWKDYPLVYAGRGKEADYDGVDVTGCLVMVDINQRDEWWINYPVYQAHLKGAAAVIAVQDNGYGEIDSEALNAQDIAGPKDAPAFSMSRKDAEILKAALKETPRITVQFDAKSVVKENMPSYNVWGTIPGRSEDMILLSGHYDSYFDGFQDDNCAIALMFGIARTLLEIGYKPEKTIVFCCMAAEEWGIENSKYDWSTGAWQQVFKVRPEWQGKVIADLNFELPAYAHNLWDAVRSTYEYEDFLTEFVKTFPVDAKKVYSEGLRVQCPIETWSDDFSVAISGIPSMVNEFSSAEFMETHYHSQFDNDEYYNADVFRFHHELYGLLVMAFDRVRVAPVNIGRTLQALQESVRPVTGREDREAICILLERTAEAKKIADEVYRKVKEINGVKNADATSCIHKGGRESHTEANERNAALQKQLLYLFRKCQDYFVRLNWHDEVLFPHEAAQSNLRHIGDAIRSLESKDMTAALDALYLVDNNQYAFQFDDEVYHYFTEYVLNQDRDRLQWGAGRIVHHVDLAKEVKSLQRKIRNGGQDAREELEALRKMEEEQLACFDDDIRYMTQAVDTLTAGLKTAKEVLNF
ncbi:Predicted aminopeptidase%2C Iap family [uncultured Clostridium sp.]|nr:Predicted aminopeptidase%2C Iap family [uncultured Clostridium sp.]